MHPGLKILICCLLLAPPGMAGLLTAQDDNRISCVALVKEDSIVLRWAPASVPAWQSGIRHGYVVKRYTIIKNGVFTSDGLKNGELLTESPLRPESMEYFDILARSDSSAMIVREVIYGPLAQPSTDNFMSVAKAYEELEVRIGFAMFICDISPVISRAAGLMFTDRNIVSGERYIYNISLANTPEDIKVEPAVIVLDAGEKTVLPEIDEISAFFTDKAVRFRWPVIFHKGLYSAYILEKSFDGKNFRPVTDLPIVNFSEEENQDYFIYTDSLDSNDQEVSYRIKGISPFGETGPASKTFTGKGVPEFSAYAAIDTAIVIENRKVRIIWRISEKETSSVSGINIMRSGKYNGPFVQINKKPLNTKTRVFTDDDPEHSNYYQVVLTSKDNVKSCSFPYFIQTEDNTPPAVPEMLSGKIDSSGMVTLAWKNNDETDLLGYKIFRSNTRDGEFIALDREISSVSWCLDSVNLNTLSQSVFYQVVAMDKNYNSSDYSDVLELFRPDTIAPTPGIITRTDLSSGKVIISLDASPSVDAMSYELYSYAEGDTSKLISWGKELPGRYEDIPKKPGRSIYYKLVTTDNSMNKASDVRSLYVPSDIKMTIVLRAIQSNDGGSIKLNWEVPPGFEQVKTNVYRSSGNEQLSIYATKENAEPFFEDMNTGLNTEYNYMIVLYSKSGVAASDKLVFNPSQKSKFK